MSDGLINYQRDSEIKKNSSVSLKCSVSYLLFLYIFLIVANQHFAITELTVDNICCVCDVTVPEKGLFFPISSSLL